MSVCRWARIFTEAGQSFLISTLKRRKAVRLPIIWPSGCRVFTGFPAVSGELHGQTACCATGETAEDYLYYFFLFTIISNILPASFGFNQPFSFHFCLAIGFSYENHPLCARNLPRLLQQLKVCAGTHDAAQYSESSALPFLQKHLYKGHVW